MGCRQTKSKPNEEFVDGLDDLNEVKLTPVKDSRQPLDARQLFKLKQSWKGIKRKMEETGIEMFIRLFKSNASIISLFSKFNECENEDDMRNNEALEYHATFVMSTLDDAISNFDNYDLCTQTLHRIGVSHIRFSGFNEEYFRLVKSHFLDAVSTTLGDRYTPYMSNVYEVAIWFIIERLVEGFSQKGDSEHLDGKETTIADENCECVEASEKDGKKNGINSGGANTETDTADNVRTGDNVTSSQTHIVENNVVSDSDIRGNTRDSETHTAVCELMTVKPQNGTGKLVNGINSSC